MSFSQRRARGCENPSTSMMKIIPLPARSSAASRTPWPARRGILAEAGYDVIDLNFACPVKKIKNKARGGHMLLDVERAIGPSSRRCAMRCSRIGTAHGEPAAGYDDSPECDGSVFSRSSRSAWSLGFAAARVHGRTVEQKYIGSCQLAVSSPS